MTGSILAVRLPHRVASGERQMAADAALLAWAAGATARLALRTYGWARPTLSLGRGEPFPEGWDAARIEADGVDVVRRPTGGDAVLHADELTFAVAASLPGPWTLSPRAFADAVADAVAGAVSGAGIAAARTGAAEADAPARDHELACFARVARGEVRAGAFKIAGLASRFARGGALCHGSLPLGEGYRQVASYRWSGGRDRARIRLHARSLGELMTGPPPRVAALASGIAAALEDRLGMNLAPATFASLGLEEP
jgi:lipoate-protein ligase A